MTDLLAIAGATRSAGSFTTYTPLDSFEQYHDGGDDFTRALALRDSDSACVVVFVKGAHEDIVGVLNTRSRLTHERGVASRALADMVEAFAPANVPADDADANEYRAAIAAADAELEALPRVKSQLTLHAVRAFDHYVRASESASVPVSADPEPDADAEQD